jgi:hypothetical protein
LESEQSSILEKRPKASIPLAPLMAEQMAIYEEQSSSESY